MRLIDADELLKRRCKVVEYDEAGFSMDYFAVSVEAINNAPTVEVKSNVNGKWVHVPGLIPSWRCSECHRGYTMEHKSRFCPNCGARME